MDHHPAHQDPCIEQRPPHGDCQGADREVQGTCRGRPCLPHAQQQRVQHPPQTDSQSLRHPQGDRLPPEKTWRIFFLVKIQALAIFRSLIGNDLETSKILYFTSFCSNSKERFS